MLCAEPRKEMKRKHEWHNFRIISMKIHDHEMVTWQRPFLHSYRFHRAAYLSRCIRAHYVQSDEYKNLRFSDVQQLGKR